MWRIFFVLSLSLPLYANGGKPASAEKKLSASQHALSTLNGLQASWDKTHSWKADFKQTVLSLAMGTEDVSKGTITVLKPNRMRWEVSDGTVQIMNGTKYISITRNERRKTTTVDIWNDSSKVVATQSLQFLAGERKLKEIYTVSLVERNNGTTTLKFTPKKKGEESLIAEILEKGYVLRALTSRTADSKVRTEFSAIKKNIPLDTAAKKTLFDYKPGKNDIVNVNE